MDEAEALKQVIAINREIMEGTKWLVGIFATGISAVFAAWLWHVRRSVSAMESLERNTEATTAVLVEQRQDTKGFWEPYRTHENYSTVRTNNALRHAAEIAEHFAESQDTTNRQRILHSAQAMKASLDGVGK